MNQKTMTLIPLAGPAHYGSTPGELYNHLLFVEHIPVTGFNAKASQPTMNDKYQITREHGIEITLGALDKIGTMAQVKITVDEGAPFSIEQIDNAIRRFVLIND